MKRGIYIKWFIGGICLLTLFAGVCILWYNYTTTQFRSKLMETFKLPLEQGTKKHKTLETTKTITSQPSIDNIEQIAKKPLTDTTQESEKTTTEKPKPNISPFGLGPYPEIPEDWDTPYLWNGCDTIYDELLTRVIIKMHNEGIYSNYSSVSIDHGTGLIIPLEYGSVLVEYETDVNGVQVIWSVKGHSDEIPPRAAIWKHASDIPSHLKVVTPNQVSFDPYEYLGL